MATIDPQQLQVALETGLRHHREGRPSEAEQIYRQVLSVQPQEPNALHLLGLLAYQAGQYTVAIDLVQRAIQVAPQVAVFYNTLGVALKMLGRLDEALQAFDQSLRLQPQYDEAWFNVAGVFSQRNQHTQADDCLRRSLAIRPNYAMAWCALGNSLVKQGRLTEGTDAFRRAVEIAPEFADGWNNLGNMMQQQGLLLEAVECYERALAVQPTHVSSADNRGTALCHLGRIEEALAAYEQAMKLDPQQAPSTKRLLAMNYSTEIDDETLFAAHREFGTWLEARTTRMPPPPFNRDPDRRLRIGYVSGDFRDHAVAHFLLSILTHHDRAQFEPIAYSDVLIADEYTARIQKLIPKWRHAYGASDADVARHMREDQVDVLVDLSGHTSMSRLGVYARRTAPLQVSYLGYANTTGLTTMDALVTDAIVDPPGTERWYTEQLVRIAPGFACYTPPSYAPDVTPSPCLSNGHVTIGLLHGLAKLNPAVFDLWCRVLREVPEVRVLLYRHSLRGRTIDVIREQFTNRGVAAQRLTIETHPAESSTHLGVYGRVDLTLDVFPWSGHTTACEALWMGVPIVTLCGRRHAGRMVSSVLTCLGRPDWIAQ
ncbi:MAG: tetratricopeptide repeat protein, partial [Planctomycetaceae bacterium]|nr:tetratricopeptide repeat protein [Planctomycetaceae bacterium]